METMRERFTDVTSRLLDEDPRVAVVLAEIGKDRFEQVKLDFGHQDVGGVLVSSYGSYDWPAGGFDTTVLYAATVRPFDRAALRATGAGAVVLVEPYLAGTSAALAAEALSDVEHRVLALGTARGELRRYGTMPEHLTAHGLDPAGLREKILRFL